MRIVIQPADKHLARFANQIGALGAQQAHAALARAVNRTTTTVHGRVIRAIRKQSDIPTAIIKRQVKRKLASPRGGVLEGVVWASGAPISLKYFKARQFAWGVRTKEAGGFKQYPGAFMGPRPGVIAPALNGHVFLRTNEHTWIGGKRTPIELLTGTSVSEELVRGESERIFRETVETMLPARVAHELGRLLK